MAVAAYWALLKLAVAVLVGLMVLVGATGLLSSRHHLPSLPPAKQDSRQRCFQIGYFRFMMISRDDIVLGRTAPSWPDSPRSAPPRVWSAAVSPVDREAKAGAEFSIDY